jgi:hypothetical protein
MDPTFFRPPIVFAALLGLGASGCDGTPAQLPPLPDTPTGSFLAVAGSNFTAGSLSTVSLVDLTVQKNIDVLDAQPVVRCFGTQLFALDETHGVVRVYDLTKNFQNPTDYSLGGMPQVPPAQANPYDIYIDAPRNLAYVTLYGAYQTTAVTGATALAVLDLTNLSAGITKFVPLPVAKNDPDNNPEASVLRGCGNNLMVLLQDLDQTNNDTPVGPGRMAVVDLTNPSNVSIIQLAGEDPTAMTVIPGCSQAVVGSAGDQLNGGDLSTSGVELVDLVGKQSMGLSVTGAMLGGGGNISTLDAADANDVFVDVSVPMTSGTGTTYNNSVYLVSAVGGTVSQQVLGPMSYVPALRVVVDRVAVLSASTPAAGQLPVGIYIGPASGAALPTEPVDVGLPPVSVDVCQMPTTN